VASTTVNNAAKPRKRCALERRRISAGVFGILDALPTFAIYQQTG
jgi:hypothetical protein